MQGYEEIFKKRGRSYHAAMTRSPHARDEEFQTVAGYIADKRAITVLDLPAGGCYLQRFLRANVNYLAYDFSGEFNDNHGGIGKCKESRIDLQNDTVDVVVSLAALHHILDRYSFYAEMHRVLRQGGQLIIGDVVAGSKIDHFLNGFVNRWNSMGHQGKFIEADHEIEEISRIGFETQFQEWTFPWSFENEKEAMIFFSKLFYLDRHPSEEQLREELNKLGCLRGKTYDIQWSLGFLLGTKMEH